MFKPEITPLKRLSDITVMRKAQGSKHTLFLELTQSKGGYSFSKSSRWNNNESFDLSESVEIAKES